MTRKLEIEKGYYLDGEDAWMMRKFLEDKYDLGLDVEDTVQVVADESKEEVDKAIENVA